MLPQIPLRIAYVNAQGLDLNTYNTCLSYIHTQKYHIVIISETWFTNRNLYLSNSFYLTESIYPKNPHQNRRQDGGLVVFTHPDYRQHLNIKLISRYCISLSLSNTSFCFAYFPPSLNDSELSSELMKIGPVDALIGDLNIRLGRLTGDSITTASSRRAIILNYTNQNSLQYLRNMNTTSVSRTDHVFTKLESLNWTHEDLLPFRSDHGLLNITLSINRSAVASAPTTTGTSRYDFKPLRNSIFENGFISTFDSIFAQPLLLECEEALNTCCHSMILPNTNDTQSIIDSSYADLIECIDTHLNSSLKKYDAHEVKTLPDRIVLQSSDPPHSVADTIRAFKRSQRSLSLRSPIVSSNPNISALDECQTHYTALYDSPEPAPIPERQNDTVFALLFTDTAIREAIMKYPLTKAMGTDGIHTTVYRSLVKSDLFLQSLSALFQLFAATNLVPTAWSECNLHLLVKKHDLPRTASNTRPIALSSILRRIFERLLMRNWQVQLTNSHPDAEWMKLDPGQAGFRRGYSTISHLLLSDEMSRHNNPFSIFLDLKSAFDRVSWTKLKTLLIQRGCPPSHLNLIISLMCTPAKLWLSVNQSERRSISTHKGVFQGGGISALIFAVYIDPLARELNSPSPPHYPQALLYADDVQLKLKSTQEATRALNICQQWAANFDMTWSIPKCAVVGECPIDLFLDGELIPKTSEYKYLGAVHRANGIDWRKTYTQATAKQSKLLTALSDRNWHPRKRLIIYRTFIRPITEYTAVLTWIWALRDPPNRNDLIKVMEFSHQSALKWIFNRRRYLKLMEFMSGFGPWIHRMECLKAGLVFSLKKMTKSNPLNAARSRYIVSTSKNFILPHCFKSAYATAFLKTNEEKRITWHTWKKQKLESLRQNASTSSATISYYNPRVNTDLSSPIFSLDWQSLDIALNWRSNNALLHRMCTCAQPFNRSHLSCILSGNSLFDSVITKSSYQTASLRVLDQSNSKHHLTVLDFLLNSRQHLVFLRLFEKVSSALDLLPPPQPNPQMLSQSEGHNK